MTWNLKMGERQNTTRGESLELRLLGQSLSKALFEAYAEPEESLESHYIMLLIETYPMNAQQCLNQLKVGDRDRLLAVDHLPVRQLPGLLGLPLPRRHHQLLPLLLPHPGQPRRVERPGVLREEGLLLQEQNRGEGPTARGEVELS